MNKLVLVGNGFDLAHGLETKYSDFLYWYLKKALGSLVSTSLYEDQLIKLSTNEKVFFTLNSLDDFDDYLKRYRITFTTKSNFIENIVKNAIDYKWVDIEAEYYSILRKIFIGIDLQYRKKENGIEVLNKSLDFIKSKLIEYLGTIKAISIINTEINQHFIRELIQDQQAVPDSNTLFLNFNYTGTVELYKNSLPNSNFSQVIYIHGNLQDKGNPIIFGYGDEMDTFYEKIEQLNNNEYIRNIKSFDYLKTSNYQDFSRFIESSLFDVYIMGHSCGLSDRILLNSIFEHENCNKIKIFYYEKTKEENDFFEKTQEISRHFRPINKGKMRNKIVPYEKCLPLTTFKD